MTKPTKTIDILVKSNWNQPDGKMIKLSPLDQIMPRCYIRLVLCFPLRRTSEDNRSSVFASLETGLQRTLTQIPFLNGVLEEDQDGSSNLHIISGSGVLLRFKDLTEDSNWSFNDLRAVHFSPSRLNSDVLAPIDAMSSEAMPSVMAAQANFVKRGLLLVVMIHHSAVDAAGLGSVLRIWAKNAELSGTDAFDSAISTISTAEALDRSSLMGYPDAATSNPQDKIRKHPQYKLKDRSRLDSIKDSDETASHPPAPPNMSSTVFYLSPENIAKLKTAASSSTGIADTGISTNDALCALMWHSITKARKLPLLEDCSSQSLSTLGFPIDGRRRLDPPLSSTYLGNVNIYGSVCFPIRYLIDHANLSNTASAIRSAVLKVDHAHIHDIISLISSLSVVTDLQPSFNNFLGPDLAISSWRHMGISDLNWGDSIGMIERVSFLKASFDGLGIIMPPSKDGGWEVLVELEAETMNRLRADEEFLRFAEVRA